MPLALDNLNLMILIQRNKPINWSAFTIQTIVVTSVGLRILFLLMPVVNELFTSQE